MKKLLGRLLGKGVSAVRPTCTAILAAAGSSQRMGGENKLLLPLDGMPVLAHTLRAVDAAQSVDEIVIAAREEDLLTYAELCKTYGIRKPVKVVVGGATRQESVLRAALEARADAKLLAVQDGARPLVTPELFDAVVLRAAVCAAAPWLVTGFMHLDGYMDVCDAVLSRRDLATRQRILKDSHCGAFAVICMVLLAMGQWSLFLAAEDVSWLALLLIPAATRACAGLAVLGLRPMGTSQYAAMGPARGGYGAVLWVLLALSVGLPLWLDGSFGPLAAAVGYGLAVWYGFRNLDGMSGDISGFALTIGELCGCGAAILWR